MTNLLEYGISQKALDELLKVMKHGDDKHQSKDGWKKVPVYQHLAHIDGHVYNWDNGEVVEEESGLHHLAHATIRLLMALTLDMEAIDDNKAS